MKNIDYEEADLFQKNTIRCEEIDDRIEVLSKIEFPNDQQRSEMEELHKEKTAVELWFIKTQ
jgi:hypothetical protein